MKHFFLRLARLVFGLMLFAFSVTFMVNAHIGYSPFDVMHAGLSKALGISFGTATIGAGFVFMVAALLMGEKLGLGTVLNILLIGSFYDLIVYLKIIPLAGNFFMSLLMLLIGLFGTAFSTYFYIGSGFGAGPRDSLMVALTRKTRFSVGVCRGAIEFVSLVIGWLLGGMVGVGTVISVVAVGFCVQITFKLVKFDPTAIRHETLDQTFKRFFHK